MNTPEVCKCTRLKASTLQMFLHIHPKMNYTILQLMYVLTSSYRFFNRNVCPPISRPLSGPVQISALFENIKKVSKNSQHKLWNFVQKTPTIFPFCSGVHSFFCLYHILNFLVQHQAGLSDPGNISSVFLYYLEWITNSKCSVSPLCTSMTHRKWDSAILKAV